MTDGRRLVAATLGRIYPYRAAKQQAPGVAATDEKGFPNRSGMTVGNDEVPGQAGDDGEGYYLAARGCYSLFEAGTELIDY